MSADWPTIALRDLCSIARGGSPRPIKNFITDDPNGINWIKIGDTQKGGRYIDNTAEKIKPEGISRSRFVEAGSFLLSNSMSFGRPYILRTSGCIHDGWLVLEPDYERIDQDFLYHILGSRTVFDQFDRLAAGSTVRNLNIGLVEGVEIPLPPLEEQQRIVAVLDEAFEGLARARAHAEANLQNARELFENFLEAELEAVGNSHETSLGEHIDLLAGFAFKSKGYTEDQRAMRLMRGDNIIPGTVRWEGAKYWPIDDCEAYEKFQLRADDVLIAMDRTWIKAGIKYAVLSDEDVPSLLVQRVARLRCLASLDTHFLAMLIGSKSFERYVLSIQTGTGVPHISPTQIRDFRFPLPDIEIQAEIVERLLIVKNGSGELSDAYSKKLHDLDDLRQSLLQKAFKGELT